MDANYDASIRQHDRRQLAVLLLLLLLLAGAWALLPRTPASPARLARPADAPPAITSPLSNAALMAGEPIALRGSGVAGRTVQVLANGVEIGRTRVDDNGTWALDAAFAEPGPQAIDVRLLDGTAITAFSTAPLRLDVTTPPIVLAAPTIDPPAASGRLAAGRLTLSGSATPGSTVAVTIDNRPVGVATADADGQWTLTATGLQSGAVAIAAQALDDDGIVAAASAPLSLTLREPTLPTFTTPSATLTRGELALSGSAEPRSRIEIFVDDELLGTTTAGSNGTWSYSNTLSTPGRRTVYARSVDADGTLIGSTQPVTLVVPLAAARPTVAEPTFVGKRWALRGTALPGATVAIRLDGETVATTTADADGNWTFEGDAPAAGTYALRVQTVDAAGDVSAAASVPTALTVPAPDLSVPQVGTVDLTADGLALTGSAEPGSTVEIEIDGDVVGSVTVDENGDWTYAGDASPVGSAELIVRQVADDGTVVASAEAVTVERRGNLIELAEAAGLTTFSAALSASGLDDELADAGPFTVFAPTDSAFAALPERVVATWLDNPAQLAELLRRHVVSGALRAEFVAAAAALPTLAGDDLTVRTLQSGGVLLEDAQLVTTDVQADNGIIHTIDKVLLPPLAADIAPPVIDDSGVPTFTGRYLTVVGSAESGTTLLLTLNGETFGEGIAAADGFWLVGNVIEPGEYEILAYMLDSAGNLLAISTPVFLTVAN